MSSKFTPNKKGTRIRKVLVREAEKLFMVEAKKGIMGARNK